MTSRVQVLSVGLDTLVLNIVPTDLSFQIVKRRVDADLQQELTLLKQRAQDEEEDIPSRFVFNDANLLMRTKGSEGFNWILHNASLTVAVNRGSKMAMLAQVRFSSEYLWSLLDVTTGRQDIGKGIHDVHTFLMTMFGDYIRCQLSACDLAVDVAYLDFGSVQDIKDCFITRAQLDDERPVDTRESDDGMLDGPDSIKRRWRRVTGLPFGARNGQVSALLYDKTHEIKYKSPEKAWFHDVWNMKRDENEQPLWDGVSPVWRNEIRYKRRALHDFKVDGVFHGIEDVYELEEKLPGLWAYAVGNVGGGLDGWPDGWLRYVVPTDDTNRSRWPVHPDWEVIQGAFEPLQVVESDHEREEREREDLLQQVDAELSVSPLAPALMKPAARRRKKMISPAAAVIPAPALDVRHFIRKRHYQVNMRQMVAQIVGCAETAEAWRCLGPDEVREADNVEPDISSTFHFLFREAEAYIEEKERVFAERVQKKRVLYSVEKTTA